MVGVKIIAPAGDISTEACGTCKSPTKETSRSLCTACLNRNIQRACETTVVRAQVSSPRSGPGALRALFPGMPRAVLGPASSETGHRKSPPSCGTLAAGKGAPKLPGTTSFERKLEAFAAIARGISKDGGILRDERVDGLKASESQKADQADGFNDGDSLKFERAGGSKCSEIREAQRVDDTGAGVTNLASVEGESQLGAENRGTNGGIEKWHLFQIQKNLTVRIPNPPNDISMRPCHGQPVGFPIVERSLRPLPSRKERFPFPKHSHCQLPARKEGFPFAEDSRCTVPARKEGIPSAKESPCPSPARKESFPSAEDTQGALPARKEVRPKATVRFPTGRKSSIKQNANAEAELMMRLLADSMPVLKSTAPLPVCKVRPAPVSPISPPGDPLWKRRCVPCPKSLKVQVTSICVR